LRTICEILKQSKTIAVIGISDKPGRDSGHIASFLKERGYYVVGIHPFIKEVFGIKVYKNLEDIETEIDIVNVFRRSDAIPEIIPGILNKKPKTLWLQTGIQNDEAVKPVIDSGIEVIQNRCIGIEYNHCK
jgi:predicted CoA-binding protein